MKEKTNAQEGTEDETFTETELTGDINGDTDSINGKDSEKEGVEEYMDLESSENDYRERIREALIDLLRTLKEEMEDAIKKMEDKEWKSACLFISSHIPFTIYQKRYTLFYNLGQTPL